MNISNIIEIPKAPTIENLYRLHFFKIWWIFAVIGKMREICLITHFWQFCNMICDSVFDMIKLYLDIQDLEGSSKYNFAFGLFHNVK